jgi:hypothetical protein
MTAAEVMDLVASACLNDSAKSQFTYAVQIPFLNTAINELQEVFEQHNIPATNKTSAPVTVPAGATTILTPPDLIEIQGLWERLSGTTNDYTEMTRKEYLPKSQVQTTALVYYSWNGQVFEFIGATTIRQVRIDYIKTLFTPVLAATDSIDLINCKTFLQYRTAGLCARFIGENPERAESLDAFAVLAIDRALGIGVKGTQQIATRRRPFRSGYKRRGYVS